MEGHPIDVEVSLVQGLPAFTIVGLPDPSIQEARERVRSAIQATGHEWPLKRVTVNLSPAHLRKAGSSFDLAMAVALLAASGRIAQERLDRLCVLGELSLDGSVRRVRGVLPAALAAAKAGARAVMVPAANAGEAALVRGLDALPVRHLGEAVRHLRGEAEIDPCDDAAVPRDGRGAFDDLAEVRGNDTPKRALTIAAAGGHNLLMIGPPGGGKTMLARRLPGILPPMTDDEAFEVTRIYSIAGLLPEDQPLVTRRPFRAPHHSGSMTGLIGGGSGIPHPGEVTLAHRGVLFLDEYGEFRREVLTALRQPLEDGSVTIVRSRWSVTYPARFQLIAASNPCPCGHLDDALKACKCGESSRQAYAERLTGPVIDRIDLQVDVPRLTKRELFELPAGDGSATVAERVAAARALQRDRLRSLRLSCNAEIPTRALDTLCTMTPRARRFLMSSVDRVPLTARAVHRVMRVGRTIADLARADQIEDDHIEEAIQMRLLDARR